MKINLNVNLGRSLQAELQREGLICPDLSEGETAEVRDDLGRALIERGLAVFIKAPVQPKKTIKAVKEEPAAEATEKLKIYKTKQMKANDD